MKLDERILQTFDQLIQLGVEVLATRRRVEGIIGADSRVNEELAYQWVARSKNLLARVFGSDSQQYQSFVQVMQERYITYSPALRAQGVLRGAKEDYQSDSLFDVRRLVEAEVFDDFLEQADHLLSAGYYAPAAVIAGCVLEDGLRKLCVRHGIALADRPKLDKMNADLAKARVYTQLVQKKVTALADIRTRAAHGKWTEFTNTDTKEMIRDVRSLMESHFA